MDDGLLGPWLIVGGYALAFVLMWIAGRLERRSPAASAVGYSLSGIAISEASLYWLSAGTGSDLPQYLWYLFPLVVTGLIMWRGWHQRNWISRLDTVGEPTFGFLPRHGLAVALDHPDPWPRRATVEFTHNGHRLLGVEYSTQPPHEDTGFAAAGKVAEEIDSINSVVELRIPNVPALTISPRTGAFEPEHFTPFEDARITRNTFGWLRPDTTLDAFEVDPEFDRRYSVYTSDPDFASVVLAGEVRELIMNDLWFRVHQVAFLGDAMWTTDTGGLTEDRMFGNSRRLAMLAATVPAPVWETWAGDREFHTVATGAETGYDGWFGTRGGFIRTPVNRKREAADRQPVTSTSLTTRSLVALGLIALGAGPVINSAAAITGLAPQVQMKVDNISGGGPRHCLNTTGGLSCSADRPSVHGTYTDDGELRQISTDWSGELPRRGDTVEVLVGPLWGHPGYQTDSRTYAVLDLLICLLYPLVGLYLAKRTYLPRSPRRVRRMRERLASSV